MSQLHRFPSPEEVVMRYPHLRKNIGHNRPIEDVVLPYSVAVTLFKLHMTNQLVIDAIKTGKTGAEITSILRDPKFEAKFVTQYLTNELQGFLE